MAIYFMSSDPQKLLGQYKKMIDDKKVETWSYDSDGDFTHTPEQWAYKAWLRPVVESDRLTLYILKRKEENISPAVYAVYHGRFIESMLSHCDQLFSSAQATALAVKGDRVRADT